MAELDPRLLAIMVCPVPQCHAALRPEGAALVCTACGRRYRIEQHWPVMIPEDAERERAGGEHDGD